MSRADLTGWYPPKDEIRSFLERRPTARISVWRGIVDALNTTSLSRHVLKLMTKERISPMPGLVLTALLFWATEHLHLHRAWAERAEGAVARAEMENPENLYGNLSAAEPEILAATSAEEAARALVAMLVDLLPE